MINFYLKSQYIFIHLYNIYLLIRKNKQLDQHFPLLIIKIFSMMYFILIIQQSFSYFLYEQHLTQLKYMIQNNLKLLLIQLDYRLKQVIINIYQQFYNYSYYLFLRRINNKHKNQILMLILFLSLLVTFFMLIYITIFFRVLLHLYYHYQK